MMFDNLIFKKDVNFYINLNRIDSEVILYKGDNIKFSQDGKKFFAKVIKIVDNVAELRII